MRIYWIWLAIMTGVSHREKLAVLEHFQSPEDIYYAEAEALSQVEGLRQEAVEALCRKDLDQAEEILGDCAKKKVHILTWQDALYPSRLKNIADAPLILYYRGILPDFDREAAVGIVGTRKASAYGLNAAKALSREIAASGGLVVSGMAEGVDAWATEGALSVGKTAVGVLGCGVDRVYPACNRKLFQQMEQQGCLLSEYPPGTAPEKWHFPRRNRIISGISCGVLVVEAPEKSGSLITARQALEQGRDVFVVPGNIGVATCSGSNGLLKDGAIPVTCGWDVLEHYESRYPEKLSREIPEPEPEAVPEEPAQPETQSDTADLSAQEQALLAAMKGADTEIDALLADAGLPAGQVLALLTMLEVKGCVQTLPGRRVKPLVKI